MTHFKGHILIFLFERILELSLIPNSTRSSRKRKKKSKEYQINIIALFIKLLLSRNLIFHLVFAFNLAHFGNITFLFRKTIK